MAALAGAGELEQEDGVLAAGELQELLDLAGLDADRQRLLAGSVDHLRCALAQFAVVIYEGNVGIFEGEIAQFIEGVLG